MTSSNKVRRYLQHHKQQCIEPQNNHQSAADLLIIDPTLNGTSMRKFRARIQQQPQQSPSTTVSVPQIWIDNEDDNMDNNKFMDDDNGHVAILDEFDEVLENELKRTSVLRTSSLKQKDLSPPIEISTNQQRSFSFALGSSTNLNENKPDEDDNYDDSVHTSLPLPSKSTKLPATIKASLSKETFSRLLHSLAFRSGNHSTSKLTMTTTTTDTSMQPSQHPCLACQNHPNLELLPKYRKRPSIFGVLVSKLNTTNTTITTPNENNSNRCSVCKRRLSKSVFYNTITNNTDEDKQQLSPATQNFSSASLTSSKLLHDHGQLLLRTKRRRSLPSLFHSLFDFDHHDKRQLDNKQIQHRPSFSSILTHTLFDSITREQQQHQQQQQSITIIKQTSSTSYSSISLSDSDDSEENINKSLRRQSITYDDSSQLTEKFQVRIDTDENDEGKDDYDNEITFDKEISTSDLNNMLGDESTNEHNNNQLLLQPPEEKTKSLLVNVFRTRRSNIALGANETNMVGKQFSVSVINLATSAVANRHTSNSTINNDSTLLNHLDQRKHALSEENLPTNDGTYIYFTNVNGQNFRERLKYSGLSENTTLREILLKLFDKYQLSIEMCNICLRSAPTLPLSLDQPVKHLLLDDLIVTGIKKKKKLED